MNVDLKLGLFDLDEVLRWRRNADGNLLNWNDMNMIKLRTSLVARAPCLGGLSIAAERSASSSSLSTMPCR